MTGAAREERKVVTVLFSDIAGSTQLGERLDPESLRAVLTRYFVEMQTIIERHGGLVSKFIGDAVMAVFGIPARHEDDALRAVRAAREMGARIADLNDEFASRWGVTLAVRTGLNTGEVLVAQPSDSDSLVVGDVVNVAARLEQGAQPGEVVVADATYRLVRDAVRAESVGTLELKGKGVATRAWRLLDVLPLAPGAARRLDAVLVGRTGELRRLEELYAQVVAERACRLVTIMGPAGVGKSRLTAEFVARLAGDATMLRGRCLPYGEGITFWPVASIVAAAVDLDERHSEAEAAQRIAALLERHGADAREVTLVTTALGSLLGSPESGIQEISWAVRRFLERLAQAGPLVVVFDDIHWGEPTFMDVLDYLGESIRDAPVMLLCQARPELLDGRPGWATGIPRASLITLAPLTDEQTIALIRALVDGTELPTAVRRRIAEVSDGNPLFVEETLRMLVDDRVLQQIDGSWSVAGDLSAIAIPPTILALLAARLDRLEPDQRALIEGAAVIGRSFWWGAVCELVPDELRDGVAAALQALVRREFVRPDRSEIRGEDAFRFTHILVRDAAYDGIPKARRAELHQQVADWIATRTRDSAGEYEQIVGYHLEQAHRHLIDLAPPNPATDTLAQRAAQTLGSAGARAFARGDMPAAVNLLSRATALLEARHPFRLEVLPELAFALLEAGQFDRLGALAQELGEAAADTGDARLQAHAAIVDLWIRFFTDPQAWAADAEREAQRTIETFGRLGEERGVARGWSLLGLVGILGSRFGAAAAAWDKAVAHARRAGNHREALDGLTWVAAALWLGPTPASVGVRRCREVFSEAQGDRKAMATALFAQGGLEADRANFEEAERLFARSRALLHEVALPVWEAGALSQAVGWSQLLRGEPARAEQELRRGADRLREIGEVSFLSTVLGLLAEAVHTQGRIREAHELTRGSEDAAGPEDVYSQVVWRSVRAKCIAGHGDAEAGIQLAAEAVDLVRTTDSLDLAWHALMCQAEVLRLSDRATAAEAVLREALEVADLKENVAAREITRRAVTCLAGVDRQRAREDSNL